MAQNPQAHPVAHRALVHPIWIPELFIENFPEGPFMRDQRDIGDPLTMKRKARKRRYHKKSGPYLKKMEELKEKQKKKKEKKKK